MPMTKAGAAMLALTLSLAPLTVWPAMLQAQDAPPPRVTRRPPSPPPVHQWTGPYMGLNIGYGLAGLTDNAPLAVTSLMYGFVGGAQAGYNWQINYLVLGVEADIAYSAQGTNYSRDLPLVGNLTVGQRIPYFGTLRGKLGFAFGCGCVMAYLTAGVAYGAYEPYATAFGITLSERFTHTAMAAGAGVEWMVVDRWSLKLEALYLDTGTIGTAISVPVLGPVRMQVRDAVTRLGVNYHF